MTFHHHVVRPPPLPRDEVHRRRCEVLRIRWAPEAEWAAEIA